MSAQSNLPWESQFEYFVAHSDVGGVCKLLDIIPDSVLLEGILRVNVDNSRVGYSTLSDVTVPDYKMYICDSEELEPVCLEVPHVKVFRSLSNNESTSWMRMLMQKELAKKHIFMKEYWQSTTEIIPVLARAGILINTEIGSKKESSMPFYASEMPDDDERHRACERALHKLVMRFCVQYDSPYLLDIYLDNCNFVLGEDSVPLLKEAAVSHAVFLVYDTSVSLCSALIQTYLTCQFCDPQQWGSGWLLQINLFILLGCVLDNLAVTWVVFMRSRVFMISNG
jgi:spatacsin